MEPMTNDINTHKVNPLKLLESISDFADAKKIMDILRGQ